MQVDWAGLFTMKVPLLEIFVRGSVMYLVIFTLLRVVFKRESGTTGITDLIVIVMLADAAQNGMAGDYQSIPEGLLLVATLMFWSMVLDVLAYRSRIFERMVRPKPIKLIENGRLDRRAMARELMTDQELFAQLRQRGARRLQDVELACIEPDGRLSVVVRENREQMEEPEKQPA